MLTRGQEQEQKRVSGGIRYRSREEKEEEIFFFKTKFC